MRSTVAALAANLLLIPSAFAGAAPAVPITQPTSYQDCVAAIDVNAGDAFERALYWRDHNGGTAAEHCAALALIALGIAVINIDPPTVMFGLFVLYGFSGYALYGWRKAKGLQTSVISTSTDEPEERDLHK